MATNTITQHCAQFVDVVGISEIYSVNNTVLEPEEGSVGSH